MSVFDQTVPAPRILVSMGDVRVRRAVTDGLQAAHIRFDEVDDADSVYQLTDSGNYAALLLDQALAGDAMALCRDLLGMLPTLFVSKDARLLDAAIDAGASEVLLHPFTNSVLLRRLQNLLALSEHQRRWHETFHQNQAAKLLINPVTDQIIDVNDAACRLYEYRRDQMLTLTINDLDATGIDDTAPLGIPTSTLFNFRHRTSSGEVRDVKLFVNPISYQGSRALYMVVSDISKRRHAEAAEADQRTLAEALRATASAITSTLELNEVLDRILEQVNNVVPSYSANIMLIEAGEARVVRSRGYPNEIGTAVARFSLPVATTPTLRWMSENRRALVIPDITRSDLWTSTQLFDWMKSYVGAPIRIGNYVIGFLNLDNDGVQRFNQNDADYLQAFADQAAIAIRNARLYTRVQRQAAELEDRVSERTAELESERSQLRAIIDGMSEGVAYIEFSNESVITHYINRAMEQITEFTAEEWIEQSFGLLRPENMNNEQYALLLQSAFEQINLRQSFHIEGVMLRKNGGAFNAAITINGVFTAEDDLVGAVAVLRDVTQEKALEAQKTYFVAHASHELRTPITNLKTRLYLMRRQPDRIDEHLRVLEHVTDRMKWLVDDLLNYSRLERGAVHFEFNVIALDSMISEIVAVQLPEAERKQQRLSCELPAMTVFVRADAPRLAQVITNLLSNAINYTPHNGTINVRLTVTEQSNRAYAQVEVQDNGVGIAAEHLVHIFEPFYRVISTVEGTGLGLSIARSIIEAHDGTLSVISEPNVGSTFRFYLPLANEPDQSRR